MLKKYRFLFASLGILIAGLILLVAVGMRYTTIVLLFIGIICTICSMFVSLPTSFEKQTNKTSIEESEETNNSEEKHHEHKGNANLENTTTSQRKHKIVCKYCKTRFPCTNDNCPHCGAPVEIESLTPECLTPVPHSKEEQTKEISNKEAKTKTTRTKKK